MNNETPLVENTHPVNNAGRPFAIIILAWVFVGGTVTQWVGWLAEQFALALGGDWPSWARPTIAIVFAGMMGFLPLLLRNWQYPRYRSVFQTWLVAALYALVTALTRLAAPNAALYATVLQIATTAVFGLLLRWQLPTNSTSDHTNAAWLLAPLLLFGWFIWGALGSTADIILTLIAAAGFGWVAGQIIHGLLLPQLAAHSRGSARDQTVGGFAIAAVLLIMAGNFGFNGMQLALMLLLPALAWVVLGVATWGTAPSASSGQTYSANQRATTVLITLAVAIPSLFIDPDELTLLLNFGGGDLVSWATYALVATIVAGLLVGLLLFLLRDGVSRWGNGRLVTGVAAILWLLLFVVYFTIGQTGLHGERLFVIMADQADLSSLNENDPVAQRTAVYQTLTNYANSNQTDIRTALDRLRIDYTSYYLVNALEVEAGPLVQWWLESRDDVDRIIPSPVLRPLPALADLSTGTASAPSEPQWNLTNIGADRVWEEFGVRGAGILIGHSDSGVEWTHPELQATYRGRDDVHSYNWFDPWNHSTEPIDRGGHGTHTLGSIVGQTVGVAPEAEWIGCANLDRNLGNPALYLDCLQFVLAPFPLDGDPFQGDVARGANVLNNSWGCPPLEGCDPLSLKTAVDSLRAAGVFVVASAGNEGPNCESVSDPIALYDSAFSVGAIDERGEIAEFSSRGPVGIDGSNRTKPDLMAPGVAVLSAFPGGTYEFNDGTSMAGPHMAGVVALIWSANPSLIGQIDATEQILIETAQPYDYAQHGLPECIDSETAPNNAVGYGLVDAYAAVAKALE
ncbi:MAG: S8 family serine peptidase [Chloroflexota bacterium]